MDLDIVPMREFIADHRAGDGIVRHQVLDRLVGEDDAPAERVVGPVPLEEVDLVRGLAQLHRNREIEPGGAAAQACDPHRRLPLGEGLGPVLGSRNASAGKYGRIDVRMQRSVEETAGETYYP